MPLRSPSSSIKQLQLSNCQPSDAHAVPANRAVNAVVLCGEPECQFSSEPTAGAGDCGGRLFRWRHDYPPMGWGAMTVCGPGMAVVGPSPSGRLQTLSEPELVPVPTIFRICLLNLFHRIHNEGALGRHRLPERSPGENDDAEAAVA